MASEGHPAMGAHGTGLCHPPAERSHPWDPMLEERESLGAGGRQTPVDSGSGAAAGKNGGCFSTAL